LLGKKDRILISLAVILAIVAFGVVGFTLVEPTTQDPWDALYLTLTTMTTVGYGDYVPTTPESKVVASVVMVVGIGAALSFFQTTFDLAMRREIRAELGLPERRTKMKDHYIICGFGNVGHQIMDQLSVKGERFIIIEKDRRKVEELVEMHVPVIEGNAENEEVLERANIREAKGLLATMPDPINLMVVITARMLNDKLRIISEVEENRNVAKLQRAGADEIVHCHEMGARVMVTKARKAIVDPVCGVEVDVKKTNFFIAFDDQEYHFCSQQCLEAFKNTPQRFIEMQRAVESTCIIK
jgi:voltage-gated potassium channel